MGDHVPDTRNPLLQKAIAAAAMVVAFTASTASWAARDFTPQAGTWVISEELNGKPGRGLAIDVQGNTFFMQVFGYENNGDATFYTATGQMQGDAVTAPLMRYQGGRSFGSEARDAVEDKSLGHVTVSFKNGLTGTIQFPNEPAVAIERFLVQSDEPSAINPRMQNGIRVVQLLVQRPQGDIAYDWRLDMLRNDDNSFHLYLSQPDSWRYDRVTYTTFQEMACQLVGTRARFSCTAIGKPPYINTNMSPEPVAGPWVDRMQIELVGYEVTGMVHMGDKQAGTSMPATGYNAGADAFGPQNGSDTTLWKTHVQQNYLQSHFSWGGATCAGCVPNKYLHTLMPINGTWVVEDELTGKPGRGLALDIQGSTAILQVYNYRADARPTFHMGSAAYLSKGTKPPTTAATIPMDEYAGGHSLGGAKQSARLRKHAGDAQLEFAYQRSDDKPLEEWMWWTAGQLQLPQEAPVRIRRLQLERPANFAEDMLGQWFLPVVQKTITLTRADGDTVTSADGLVVCTPVTNRKGVDASCGQPGENGAWVWHQFLSKPLMNRGGTMVRLRDRHGNAVGLGQLD